MTVLKCPKIFSLHSHMYHTKIHIHRSICLNHPYFPFHIICLVFECVRLYAISMFLVHSFCFKSMLWSTHPHTHTPYSRLCVSTEALTTQIVFHVQITCLDRPKTCSFTFNMIYTCFFFCSLEYYARD